MKACDKAVCCDLCNKWNNIKCNNLNDLGYENLKLGNEFWYCKACIQEILPVYSKKVNPNNIISKHSSIDPNLKKFLCQ